MTENQKTALKLRAQDMTMEEIANEMGCTSQYVQQLLHSAVTSRFRNRAWYRHEIIYPNIDRFVKENDLTLSAFARECGYGTSVPIRNCIVLGHAPKKDVIDAILKVTGMTYEEAFKKDGDSNE